MTPQQAEDLEAALGTLVLRKLGHPIQVSYFVGSRWYPMRLVALVMTNIYALLMVGGIGLGIGLVASTFSGPEVGPDPSFSGFLRFAGGTIALLFSFIAVGPNIRIRGQVWEYQNYVNALRRDRTVTFILPAVPRGQLARQVLSGEDPKRAIQETKNAITQQRATLSRVQALIDEVRLEADVVGEVNSLIPRGKR